jgi:hypothetical protein
MVVALVPYVALVTFCQSWLNYPYLLRRQLALGRLQLKQHFFLLFGPLMAAGAVAAMVMLPGDPSWAQGTTTHRRGLFYAFLAFSIPLMGGYLFGAQPLNLRLFIDTYLRKGETNE